MRHLIVLAILLLFGGVTFAHPGRTDASGGHHDRKNGGYHHHGGGGGGGGGLGIGAFPTPSVPVAPRERSRTKPRTKPRTSVRTTAEDPARETVYVTKSGSKYHAAGCRHLKSSSIPIQLADTVARYSPCSVCDPPTLGDLPETEDEPGGVRPDPPRLPQSDYQDDGDDVREPLTADQAIAIEEQRRQQEAETRREAARQVADEARQKLVEELTGKEKRAAGKLAAAIQVLKKDRAAGKRWLNEIVKEFDGTDAAKKAADILEGQSTP